MIVFDGFQIWQFLKKQLSSSYFYLERRGFDVNGDAFNDKSFHLTIGILSGRHLSPEIKRGSSCDTSVKIEIIGCPKVQIIN